ncbi:MAG: gamma carbonic anhydrase family protein [Thiohalophilus sp.]|jgi:carbonic anhydrase/acetyltransferase-like protein (isoleucine patch superfamily)
MAIRDFENILPDLHPDAYVDETALVIGDVTIGKDSSIWPLTVVRGDVNRIRIGANTNIQDNSVLHVSHDGPYNPGGFALDIGDNVTVGHRVILHGCTIHNDCLVGMGSTIMDGVIVHPYTIIGAGSLVTPGKELEGGFLWLGSPARKVRELTDEERESIAYSAQHYVKLKNRHQQS